MDKSFYHKFDNMIENRMIRKVRQSFGIVLEEIKNNKPFEDKVISTRRRSITILNEPEFKSWVRLL